VPEFSIRFQYNGSAKRATILAFFLDEDNFRVPERLRGYTRFQQFEIIYKIHFFILCNHENKNLHPEPLKGIYCGFIIECLDLSPIS
jgi:hypothetical protein